MKRAWQRFLTPLTPGVRVILVVLTVMYLAAIVGGFSRAYDLYPLLGLRGVDFWSGQVWPLLTYALLPAGIWDFLFNWVLIMFLGVWLERSWSRRELWACCLLGAVAVGLIKVLVQPTGTRFLVGTMPVTFALLAAWGRLFPYERILLWFLWDMSVREAAILMIVIGFVVMLPCAGLVNAAIILCGVPAGMLYVWLRSKLAHGGIGRSVESQRMGRLEL